MSQSFLLRIRKPGGFWDRTFLGAALLVEPARRPLAGRDAAAAQHGAAAAGGAPGCGAGEDAAGVECPTGAAGGEARPEEMGGEWME